MIDTSGQSNIDTSGANPTSNPYFVSSFRCYKVPKYIKITLNPLTEEDKKEIKDICRKFEENITKRIRRERYEKESKRINDGI